MTNFLKKYKNSFLFGALAGLGFPPLYLIIFLPISFYYLITKIIESKDIKESFLFGLLFGFGYFLIQLYWISFSLIVDIRTYFWLFPFAIVLIPFACALFFAFSTLILFLVTKKLSITNRFAISVIFALSYVILEYIKGLIFPWNLFSYILGFSNTLIQIASLINIFVLDFILILFFGFGFVLFEYKNKKITFLGKQKYYIIFYVFILTFIIIFGMARLHNVKIRSFDVKFRIIQANIPQTLKWDKNEAESNIEKHNQLTQAAGFNEADVIIWSESSIPFLLTQNAKLPDKFSYLNNKILISGAVRAEVENNELTKVWNSIFIFKNENVINYYDKSLLVPFGEYVPLSKYIPFIKKITNSAIDFSKGNGNKTIKINGIKVSPIICYEVIFPNNIINKNDKPDIIINLTNDAWFGRSSGPYQHLVSAKFRAVENKIPVIRVANSGISAYIDEYGRIIKRLNLNKDGILDI